MCGIFGFISANKYSQLNSRIMYILGTENNFRGPDSTGIVEIGFDVPNMYDPKSKMKFKSFKELINFSEYKKHITPDTYSSKNIIIGHVRKASVGLIDKNNIHPHIIGNTVLAHNGTIQNLDEVKEVTKKEWDNDSKHLAYLINKQGNIKPAEGSATMVWFSLLDKSLNIAKFERDISVAYNDDILIYSSDTTAIKKVNECLFLDKLKSIVLYDRDKLTIKIDSENEKIVVEKESVDWFKTAPRTFQNNTNYDWYNNNASKFSDDEDFFYEEKITAGYQGVNNKETYENSDLLHDYYNG